MSLTELLKRKNVYDGKLLWETYHSWGKASSHKRLREWAQTQDMINHETGKVSQMGAYWAMWRYAMRNPHEAWPAYEAWAKEHLSELMANGIIVDFELFLKDIQRHALNRTVASKKAYEEFCEKWNLPPIEQKPVVLIAEREVEA